MRVLCYTSPARSHLFSIMPVLLELQGRGHDVAVHTLESEVGRLREAGLKAAPVDPAIPALEHTDFGPGSAQARLKRSVLTFARRAEHEVPDMQAAIAAEQSDVLLVDSNSWGASAVAEASGLPWAQWQAWPTPIPSPDVPPFGPGLRPLGGPVGRLRNRLLRPVFLGVLERVLLPPMGEMRAAVGLGAVGDATDLYTRAPLTLYLTSTAFEYPRRDWPDSYCFVGPINWEPDAEGPTWLDRIDRPIVLVTTSSEYQEDAALVEAALAGLANEPVEVIATMPAGGADQIAVPDNARVEDFVPHSVVLRKAAVAITHGGMGATQKALAAGVPVVVVPFGRDQAEVGRRAETAGAGVMLSSRRLTPRRIRDAARRARQLRSKASELASRMNDEGGAPLAVDRLEALR